MEWSDLFGPAAFPPQFEVDHHKNQHPAEWTFEENKAFENALAEFGIDSPAIFNHVASRVPSKSMDEIKRHHACFLRDVEKIEAGLFSMPRNVTPHHHDHDHAVENNQGGGDQETKREKTESSSKQVARKTCSGNQRKRGIPWTEEEHQLFLMGLNKYGKGDWRSISRYYVMTKTPTQVASHAQKFYRRQVCTTPTDRRRPSIHDIQTVNSSFFPYPPQMNNMINPILTNELIPPQVPNPNPNGLTPMNNNYNNIFHSNEGFMTNYGTEIGTGFPPGTSTFPIASSAVNQPPGAYPSSSTYPNPYQMNYP